MAWTGSAPELLADADRTRELLGVAPSGGAHAVSERASSPTTEQHVRMRRPSAGEAGA